MLKTAISFSTSSDCNGNDEHSARSTRRVRHPIKQVAVNPYIGLMQGSTQRGSKPKCNLAHRAEILEWGTTEHPRKLFAHAIRATAKTQAGSASVVPGPKWQPPPSSASETRAPPPCSTGASASSVEREGRTSAKSEPRYEVRNSKHCRQKLPTRASSKSTITNKS
jgi:hypothetical protein